MRLKRYMITVAAALATGAAADDQAVLPKCDMRTKLTYLEPSETERLHMPAGHVLVEFNIDGLGHVSDPKVIESSDKRLNEPSLKSVLRWRFVPPPKACRHKMTINLSD
jgi:TonB family protein